MLVIMIMSLYLYLDGTVQLEMKLTGIVESAHLMTKFVNDAQDIGTEEIVSQFTNIYSMSD